MSRSTIRSGVAYSGRRDARFGRAFLGALVVVFLLVGSAQASPIHPFLPELSLDGSNTPAGEFDRACGVAVDSEGDVYTASAASGKIDVFDPSHNYLTTISNSNEPCGLAVDSKGSLYASETKTGKVVKYAPNAYPFSGTPTYGAPSTIDASGSARGIAIDTTDDSLYVTEGSRVNIYKSDGTLFTRNEVQALRFPGSPSGGTYTLSFEGAKTEPPLPYNATVAEIQAALEALPAIGAGNVEVVSGEGREIKFKGALAAAKVPQILVDDSALVGSSAKIETRVQGFNGHLGEGELTGASGVSAYNRSYISVADAATDEIKVFVGSVGNSPGTLELRRTIDGSETPDGSLGLAATGAYLGVDPISGHLYAYDSQHKVLDEFEASGRYMTQVTHTFADAKPTAIAVKPQWDEIQQVAIDATGGSFKLGFEGEETASIPFNAAPTKVQEALEALAAIGPGGVSVIGAPAYRIAFVGALGKHDVSQLGVDGSSLSGDNVQVPGTGPSATAITLKQGYGPGAVFVTSGAGAGAEALAFGPLPDPTRGPLPKPHSMEFEGARGTVVDSHGDLYVAGSTGIKVFAPEPTEFDAKGNPKPLTSIPNYKNPWYLAVDSEGNLYAAEFGAGGNGDERVALYKPQVYPPTMGTTYSGPTIVDSANEPRGVAVNPANGHLFVTHAFVASQGVTEYDSAKDGSGVLNPDFGSLGGGVAGIDAYGANGDVYIVDGSAIDVFNADGTELLASVNGSDSPRGPFGSLQGTSIAVDQSDGHVLLAAMLNNRGAVEEFEPSGAFVGEAGSGSFLNNFSADVAVDNSGGPNDGDLYVANFNSLSAFGPLSYGEPPIAVSGTPSEVGGGEATLNGTVDPRGATLEECHFDYTTEADFQANWFSGPEAEEAECVPNGAEIGPVSGAVAVHVRIGGLDPEERYHFGLFAKNKYGPGESKAGLFGPPLVTTKPPLPILYHEATLRALVDPSGLATKYRFEYRTSESYGQSTKTGEIPAGDGAVAVETPITGLQEGAEYHFRLLAENEEATVPGPDQSFTTLARPAAQSCPNEVLRLENDSSGLPDCRAYELVTPADTRGNTPFQNEHPGFNSWFVDPQGGNSLGFSTLGTQPGSEGNGIWDGWRMSRDPKAGWSGELVGPSFAEVEAGGGSQAKLRAFSPEQRYSFWDFGGGSEGSEHLRTPAGFEALGKGSLGLDPKAQGMYISSGASHVIFITRTSCGSCPAVQLEPEAPTSAGAIYDRSPGGPTHVVSLPPEGASAATQAQFETDDPEYKGASVDGSSVVFEVGGNLYLRRHDTGPDAETVKVADGPLTFAGISDNGGRVFYTDGKTVGETLPPANLYAFDAATQTTTPIAPDSKFVNVSGDGSRVYFSSKERLDDAEEGVPGLPNLYLWDGAGIRLVAVLDPEDLNEGGAANFPGTYELAIGLDNWADQCVNPTVLAQAGRGACPSRSTPDGGVLVFQSHADLTGYEGQGHSEIYRYDAADGSLTCVSCDPSGAPATAEADFESYGSPPNRIQPNTLIPNVTDDGDRVIFQTAAALLPEDANSVTDVYEWQAQGTGSCTRSKGCLALISSGQGDNASTIYAMTPSGHDVFFSSLEKLVGSDIPGSPSIYDARVDGGFPNPVAKAPCQGDSCQGSGSVPPVLQNPASGELREGGNVSGKAGATRCRKGERRVVHSGKPRCVKRHHQRHRANHKRRAGR